MTSSGTITGVNDWAQRRLAKTGPARFEERHPVRAAQETAFRRQARAIRKEFGRSTVSPGTPETRYHASRARQGALARLFAAGDLSIDELGAAVEIATIAERIGRDAGWRGLSLETRVDQSRSGDGTFFERLGAVRAEVAYGRWRAGLAQPAPVLAMIVEDIGVSVAAKRYRMRNVRAKALLLEALWQWSRTIGDVVREIDADDLIAAQAGLN